MNQKHVWKAVVAIIVALAFVLPGAVAFANEDGQDRQPLGPFSGGSIVAWGSNDFGQCDVPAPNSNFTAIATASGGYYGLGLKSNGSIVAWGMNSDGQCDVPVPNSDFTAVVACCYSSLGLKSNGSIVAWGSNYYGEGDVPAPNSNFTDVAAGEYHGLGLKSNGSIVAWGRNTHGQCDVPAPNSDFTAVAGGGYHSLGLKSDGSIVAWGSNRQGQCDVPLPNSDFTDVDGGGSHSLGLRADGSIVAWGRNTHGQCDVPAPNSDFTDASSGFLHSLGLKSNGSIVGWGWNVVGQCDVPSPNSNFTDVSAGYYYSLGLKDHLVVTYTLDISVDGSGTTDPAVGVHIYSSGAVVTLEAFPDSGWEFDAWSGDITTMDNPTNITMDGNKSVTATFTEIQIFYLTMSVVGSGTTDPAVGVHIYSSGAVVTLTAIADSGWVFDQWSGDMSGSTNPDNITMDGNKTVTATFVEEECPIEIEISGGFGVNVLIRNTGEEDITDLEYSITLDGGLILLPIGGITNGTVDIPADGEISVRARVLGLGKTEITVTAGCAEETATGLVLLFFVLGVEQTSLPSLFYFLDLLSLKLG